MVNCVLYPLLCLSFAGQPEPALLAGHLRLLAKIVDQRPIANNEITKNKAWRTQLKPAVGHYHLPHGNRLSIPPFLDATQRPQSTLAAPGAGQDDQLGISLDGYRQ